MNTADRGRPSERDMLLALARSNVALNDLATALSGLMGALRKKGVSPAGKRVDAVGNALKVASIAAVENQRIIAMSGGGDGAGG